jgi:hypothetical protein
MSIKISQKSFCLQGLIYKMDKIDEISVPQLILTPKTTDEVTVKLISEFAKFLQNPVVLQGMFEKFVEVAYLNKVSDLELECENEPSSYVTIEAKMSQSSSDSVNSNEKTIPEQLRRTETSTMSSQSNPQNCTVDDDDTALRKRIKILELEKEFLLRRNTDPNVAGDLEKYVECIEQRRRNKTKNDNQRRKRRKQLRRQEHAQNFWAQYYWNLQFSNTIHYM